MKMHQAMICLAPQMSVVKVLEEQRSGKDTPIQVPATCPECGTDVERVEGRVAIRCPNFACPAQIVRHLQHFASRLGMDIRGLGEKQTKQLWREGLLKDAADLFTLRAKDLERLIVWMDTYAQRAGSFDPAQERRLAELRRRSAGLLG